MAQRFDDASKSQYDLKYDGPLAETTKLAEDVRNASSLHSVNVRRITFELKVFASVVEKA